MTNARIQRALSFATGLLFLIGAGLIVLTTHLKLGLVLLLALLLTPAVLALDCAWAAWVNRSDRAPRASAMQWCRAWWAETVLAFKVFGYWQPFKQFAIRDHLPESSRKRGIVLVHGYFCNRALWTPHMHRLHRQGTAFISIDLEPAFGSISDYTPIIEEAVRKIEQCTGQAPVLVGHSMGGLAIRAWAASHPATLGRVHKIITLGTPHHGTAIATFAHTTNGLQMRRGSDWQNENIQHLQRLFGSNFAKKCICFYSNCDNIVFPACTATLEQADNRHIAGVAHVELAYIQPVQQAIDESLKS